MKQKPSECQLARRFWRGHFRSDSANYVKELKEMPKWRIEKEKR
jgi:hypothetical protein